MPSGFVLTVLTDEKYWTFDERDDRAFYNLLKALKSRLDYNLVVRHPVLSENLTETKRSGVTHNESVVEFEYLRILTDNS